MDYGWEVETTLVPSFIIDLAPKSRTLMKQHYYKEQKKDLHSEKGKQNQAFF